MRLALCLCLCLIGCAHAGGLEVPDASSSDEDASVDASRVPLDATIPLDAALVSATLSETQTQDVVTPHTVNCNTGTETAENHTYRVFPLASFSITTAFHLTEVTFGIEAIIGGTQIATVNVGTYSGTVTSATTSLATSKMSQLASANVSLPVSDVSTATVPVVADIPANGSLFVEIVLPSELGAGRMAFLGSNNSTELLPSFISTPDVNCATPTPVSYASINHPEVHIVLTATGSY